LMLELENGRVDAIIGDSIAVILAAKASGRDFVQIQDLVTESVGAGIAIRKGNPKLHAAMQKALDDLQADGTYLKIAKEWVGADIR
jgi:polar amino acid transport system substrate-binding protein